MANTEKKQSSFLKKMMALIVALMLSTALGYGVTQHSHRDTPHSAGCGSGCSGHGVSKRVRERAVALVNGVEISRDLFERSLRGVSEKSLEGDSAVLENLITVELLYQTARSEGVELDPKAGYIRADMIARAYESREAFLDQLALIGMTEEEYRHEWYRQATIDMFIEEEIEAKVVVTDRQLRRLYNRLARNNRDGEALPFEEVKADLYDAYLKEATRQQVDELVTQLHRESDIQRL